MDVLPEDFAQTARKQGRQASATVSGRRRAGFLVGNKFVFSDQYEILWMQTDLEAETNDEDAVEENEAQEASVLAN